MRESLPNPLPRELSPGVFWLGQCMHFPGAYDGHEMHGYNSVYVVAGDDHSIIVEGGHPQDLPVIEQQLDALMRAGLPEPKYIFTTHTETPHSSGVGRYLEHFPQLTAVGEISDLHLVFPQFVDRLEPVAAGDAIDLGGTELVVVEAVFRDFLHTRWAFDTKRRVLFTGDGFAYSHWHQAGQCGCVAEEVSELDIPGMTSLFAQLAFRWTRFVDIEPYIVRLDELILEELDADILAPTHGLPITDPVQTLTVIREGLRRGSRSRSEQLLAGPGARDGSA